MLSGLDEFMLRLGHLKVLCHIVTVGGGSWRRINQEAAEILKSPTKIDFDTDPSVAEYLFRKGLCRFTTTKNDRPQTKPTCRYPDILVHQIDSRSIEFGEFEEFGSSSSIWWQDYCLANPGLRSTVGAVTTDARSGSKTGFSHICDWAISLDLIAKNGQILPSGRLISPTHRLGEDQEIFASNPYLLGSEVIVIAFAYLVQDMDIFSRLLPKIVSANQPLTRGSCGYLFVEALDEAVSDGEQSRRLSAGGQQKIFRQLRDLEKAARRSGRSVGETSTAWHRAASRFETYVDLGLLDKARRGNEEKFKYVYYANDASKLAAETLKSSQSSEQWIDDHLSATVFGSAVQEQDLDESELLAILPRIAKQLSLPTRLLPIDSVVLGIVRDAYEMGICLSISRARDDIENLARNRSDLARLSRGSRGSKAEYVSLDVKAMEA